MDKIVQVRLSVDEKNLVKSLAYQEGKTMKQALKEAILEWISRIKISSPVSQERTLDNQNKQA